MDNHEHKHVHTAACRKPRTATEAMLGVLSNLIEEAHAEYHKLPWWNILRKAYFKGVLTTLTGVANGMLQMEAHFNNDNGTLN